MNILLFVTSMIMVMAMLTYARIETYRSFSLLQAEFKHYIDKSERGYINLAAEERFEQAQSKKKTANPGSGTQPKNPQPATPATPVQPTQNKPKKGGSRLSFLVFIDQKKKDAYHKEYPKLLLMAKKLIYNLYRDQPFFKEMVQKRGDFVDALLNALMIADNLPKKEKLKKAKEFANLELEDPELNRVFYKMLQKTIERPEKETANQFPEEKGEEDDTEAETEKKEEFQTPKGYYSLLDMITLQDTPRVRVYLASKKLLSAIFDDPAVVKSIIEGRRDLYNKVRKGAMDNQQASDAFKNQFAPLSDRNFDESVLDFDVTSTNPKNYE